MLTLIVGDVHGCADELSELVGQARPDHVVLVGDLFTKGPDPAGVWDLIRGGGWRSVLGNHDDRLLTAIDSGRPDRTASEAIAALDASDPAWLPWTRALPLFLEVAGFTVVHAGLHPTGELAATSRERALVTRRWPDDDDERNPFWYEVYTGSRRVVFGHDAMRGLVRVEREGLPHLIGLDTGCVYGGRLSGYLPEEDRVVQVEARRPWFVPKALRT